MSQYCRFLFLISRGTFLSSSSSRDSWSIVGLEAVIIFFWFMIIGSQLHAGRRVCGRKKMERRSVRMIQSAAAADLPVGLSKRVREWKDILAERYSRIFRRRC